MKRLIAALASAGAALALSLAVAAPASSAECWWQVVPGGRIHCPIN